MAATIRPNRGLDFRKARRGTARSSRRLAALLLFAVALTLAVPPATAQPPITVVVNGETLRLDPPPVIVHSRVLIPLRGVLERLGATVDWEAATRTIRVFRGSTVVVLAVGHPEAQVDGRSVRLDVAPVIIGGRAFVPLRFVSAAIGAQVEWRADERTVVIRAGGEREARPEGTIIMFFFLVNRTGREIQIQVAADGRILFTRTLGVTASSSGSSEVGEFRPVELKAALPRDARTLEVRELSGLGLRRVFDITGFAQRQAGFRIVITWEGIMLTQDYLPIR